MADMPSFVQGASFDPASGNIRIYNPLVVDAGTAPGCPLTAPALVQGAIVALWFGTNGNTLTLKDNAGSLFAGVCVNGFLNLVDNVFSIFGQFAYCNAVVFFDQVKASARVTPPPLGIAADGLPCPTTRDYFVVDMDPNDNVITAYLLLANGLVCQNTSTNFMANMGNIQKALTNGSDERLVIAMYNALGGTCKIWTAIDLAETNPLFAGMQMVPAVPLNEIQASRYQLPPIALVPLADPMTVDGNGQPLLGKTNAYRAGVGQPKAITALDADSTNFCFFYYTVQPLRLLRNMGSFVNFPSPDPAAANNLFNFLAQRYFNGFGPNGLDCANKLQIPAPGPITVTLDANGVAIAALIIPPNNGVPNAAATNPLVRNDAQPVQALAWSTTQIVAALLLLSGLIV